MCVLCAAADGLASWHTSLGQPTGCFRLALMLWCSWKTLLGNWVSCRPSGLDESIGTQAFLVLFLEKLIF